MKSHILQKNQNLNLGLQTSAFLLFLLHVGASTNTVLQHMKSFCLIKGTITFPPFFAIVLTTTADCTLRKETVPHVKPLPLLSGDAVHFLTIINKQLQNCVSSLRTFISLVFLIPILSLHSVPFFLSILQVGSKLLSPTWKAETAEHRSSPSRTFWSMGMKPKIGQIKVVKSVEIQVMEESQGGHGYFRKLCPKIHFLVLIPFLY